MGFIKIDLIETTRDDTFDTLLESYNKTARKPRMFRLSFQVDGVVAHFFKMDKCFIKQNI